MARLSPGRTNLAIVAAGVVVLIAGFFVGRTVAENDSTAPEGEIPRRTATRQASVAVPTLGAAAQIPTLKARAQAPESVTDESSAVEAPAETESGSPTPEAAPEVTVAPNG